MKPTKRSGAITITTFNLVPICVYFSVRHCIRDNWIVHRDQFLPPLPAWESDLDFQIDCIIFILFQHNNRISINDGINHWIPFEEVEVGAKAKYWSDFMVRLLRGQAEPGRLWSESFQVLAHLSPAARAVYKAGKALWRHYHVQPDANPDASLYDIRAYFQGRDEQGKVKTTSADSTYRHLNQVLKKALETLAEKIADKAYEYAFLRR